MDEEASNEKIFEDTLDFNAWQLTPAYPSKYSNIIGKDAPLSNISNQRDMEHIDTNLRIATYLSGIKAKYPVGYAVFLSEQKEPIILEETNIFNIYELFKEKTIVRLTKIYDEKKIFDKSIHNKLARAYTRMSLSRGINGQAAKDLKTVRSEENKQLIDLTNRNNFNPFSKKKPTAWGNYEMQK